MPLYAQILLMLSGITGLYLILLAAGALVKPAARAGFVVATYIGIADLVNLRPNTLEIIILAGLGAVTYTVIGMTVPDTEIVRGKRRPVDPLLDFANDFTFEEIDT